MAGPNAQKRRREEAKHKLSLPRKKVKKQREYHSGSESEDSGEDKDFKAVNLLDSDDDNIHDTVVDDGASSADGDSDISDSITAGSGADSFDLDSDDDTPAGAKKPQSKRNDPTAFATSLNKILNTKLSSTRRTDPVLSRSTDAALAAKEAVDAALEAKARRKLREQRRLALEKGRVRDVLLATRNETSGEAETTTTEILAEERRLRKVAQRGVVKLFNAVRAAQVRAAEAEKQNRKEGVIGQGAREKKVNEMSRQGFLDLIASGGGGLSKKALEEA